MFKQSSGLRGLYTSPPHDEISTSFKGRALIDTQRLALELNRRCFRRLCNLIKLCYIWKFTFNKIIMITGNDLSLIDVFYGNVFFFALIKLNLLLLSGTFVNKHTCYTQRSFANIWTFITLLQ